MLFDATFIQAACRNSDQQCQGTQNENDGNQIEGQEQIAGRGLDRTDHGLADDAGQIANAADYGDPSSSASSIKKGRWYRPEQWYRGQRRRRA
ncbi:hypothetical protein D3C78_1389390 [compost metagenome]